MEINWIVIGAFALAVLVLILFMIKKNQKEKKKLTEFLNNDFKKSDQDDPDFEDTANEK